MIILNRYENGSEGGFKYDCAIGGVPFLMDLNADNPLVRKTSPYRKEQVDNSAEAGEQSLQGWWIRSQSSFHRGAGIKMFDTAKDEELSNRYNDSHGVDVMENLGQMRLLHKATNVNATYMSSSYVDAVSYSLDTGAEGILYAHGGELRKTGISDGANFDTEINWGGNNAPIWDLTSNGEYYFVLSSGGIYAGAFPASNATKMYNVTTTLNPNTGVMSPRSGVLAWVKDRLIAGIGNKLYELTMKTSATALPDPLSKGPVSLDGWRWTAISEGPGAIFVAGYSGNTSALYKIVLDEDDTLSDPIQVAPMPYGEIITSMMIYTGNILVIGTNKGIRIGTIQSDNSVNLYSLTLKTDATVYSIFASENYVYAGGANSDGKVGMYRINLGDVTDSETGTFAYQKYLFANDATFGGTRDIMSIVPIGLTGDRLAFAVRGAGLYRERSIELVDQGWLTTGKTRMDTLEKKIFQYATVYNESNGYTDGGHIEVYWFDEYNNISQDPLIAFSGGTVQESNFYATDAEPHISTAFKFVLKPNSTKTISPTFNSYQLKATPSGVKQRLIELPLNLNRKQSKAGGSKLQIRKTFDIIKQIEFMEEKAAVVIYQDFVHNEERFVLIEQVQYSQSYIGDYEKNQISPDGRLYVQIRTVDNNLLALNPN